METILHFVLPLVFLAPTSVKVTSFKWCQRIARSPHGQDIGNFCPGIESWGLVKVSIWRAKRIIFAGLILAWLIFGPPLMANPVSLSTPASLASTAKRLPLANWVQSSKAHLVRFSDIPPTDFAFNGATVLATVNKSSAALVFPLSAPVSVSEVSVHWRRERGLIKLASPEQELEKDGDDAWWRIGLVLAGEAPTVPFFAPAWVKELRDILILPSKEMVYLVAGSQQAAGKKWENPYSSSISCLSMHELPAEQGWTNSHYRFSAPQKVVGFWLMADGDNTASEFAVSLDLDKSWIE